MGLMKSIRVFLLCLPLTSYAESDKNIIYDTIRFLQPKQSIMDHSKAVALTNFAHKVEKELGLEWEKAIAIIYQESSFRTDPQDCLRIERVCTADIGIGQINWKLWNRVFEIERLRLASDYEYNLEIAYNILKYYKKNKGKYSYWYEYYHSGTPSKRKTYRKDLKSHYDKIVVYTRGYLDGRHDERRIRRINYYKSGQRQEVHLGYAEEFIYNFQRGCEGIRPPLKTTCI